MWHWVHTAKLRKNSRACILNLGVSCVFLIMSGVSVGVVRPDMSGIRFWWKCYVKLCADV